jgi:spore coat polysaccharide biosynthesis predicted glycosyltransferase SpsG
MWERCYLGLPTITVVSAANQKNTTEDVSKLGAIEYLGWTDLLDSSDYVKSLTGLIMNPERVKQIGQLALSVLKPREKSLGSVMQSILSKKNYKNNVSSVEQEES